jgi:hypothetical protein
LFNWNGAPGFYQTKARVAGKHPVMLRTVPMIKTYLISNVKSDAG